MTRARMLSLTLLAASMLFATGCGRGDSTGTGSTSTSAGGSSTTGSDLEGTVTVSAASSLKVAFTRIGDDFSATNPGVEITFNFGSSSTLSTQIREGAPADVYASADEANMIELTNQHRIAGDPEVFARNELVIITKPGNPDGIATLADLADVGTISLCGEEVPCGRYAQQALEKAGVTMPESSVTRGQNATATLNAVAQGDAVAGIVYVTDARSSGDALGTVPIPATANVIATYPIAALEASGNAEVARAFMAYVLSDEGQAVLAEHGFLPPS